MNVGTLKMLVTVVSLAGALLGLVVATIALRRGAGATRAKLPPLFIGGILAGACAAAALLLALPAHQGLKGMAAAAAAGVLVGAMAILLHVRVASSPGDDDDIVKAWAPALVLVTLAFLVGALLFRQYGLRATGLWLSLDLGVAWAFLVGKGVLRERLEGDDALPLDCAAGFVLLAPLAASMGGYHYAWPSEKASFLPVLMLYLVGMGWIVPAVLRMAFRRPPSIAVRIVGTLALSGLFVWLCRMIITMSVDAPACFQALAIGVVTSLLLLSLAALEGAPSPSSLYPFLGVAVFVTFLWASFKAAAGFGVALGALGLLFPLGVAGSFESPRAHGGRPLGAMRVYVFALGAFLLWRVFLEYTRLVNFPVDMGEANVFAALAAGLVFPFLCGGGLLATLAVGALVTAGVGLFALKSGVAAFLLGIFLSAIAAAAGRGERSAPALGGLLAFPFAAALCHPLVEQAYALTRAQKSSVMLALLGALALFIVIATLAARRGTHTSAPSTE